MTDSRKFTVFPWVVVTLIVFVGIMFGNIPLLDSPILLYSLTGIYFLILICPLIHRLLTSTVDPFESSVVLVVSYTLYTVVPLLGMYIGNAGFNQIRYIQTLTIYIAGLIAFWLGYYIPINPPILASSRYLPKFVSPKKTAVTTFILISIGLITMSLSINLLGGLSSLQDYGYAERRQALSSFGPLLALTYLVNIGLILGFHVVQIQRSFWIRLFLAASFFTYSYILFRLGRRLPFLQAFLPVIAYYHYRIRRVSLRQATLIVIICVATFSIWGRVRNTAVGESVLTNVRENISVDWFDPSKNELSGGVFTTLTILDIIPDLNEHTLGRTYVEAFLILIPLQLFPSRPAPPGEWLVKTYFPDVYARGGGFAFSLITEAYMNFSYLGAVLILFIVGIMCRFLTSTLRNNANSASITLIYCAILPWIIIAMRSHSASILKGLGVFTLVPLLTVLFICARAEPDILSEDQETPINTKAT